LSPILFAIYIDVHAFIWMIIRLNQDGCGCQLQSVYLGCLLCADDIMLLSHSLCAMNFMLKICEDFAAEYDLKFSTYKYLAIRIVYRHNKLCKPLVLSSNNLQFVSFVKYLSRHYAL